MNLFESGKSAFSQVGFNSRVNTPWPSAVSFYTVPLWNLFRFALVCACILFAVLMSMVYSLNQAGTTLTKNGLILRDSPLRLLLIKDQNMAEDLQGTDCGMLRKINEQATLELKSLVIAETVVPYQDLEKLAAYVKQILESTDVITELQKQAIMVMVHLAPMEASINKEETGDGGTLRNSAVIALFKRHLNNVHFMLIGIRAEPRLGWRWISSTERNAWNDVLSRVIYNKVRVEAKNYLWHGVPIELGGDGPKPRTITFPKDLLSEVSKAD